MLIFLKKILKKIGPGFVTGAADDDPSGIATYSQTGSIFGFSQLWLALFTAVIIILEVFVSYKKYSKILKYLTFTLLTYVLTAFISKPNWGSDIPKYGAPAV